MIGQFSNQRRKCSQDQYAHFGSRISPKTTLNAKFETRDISLDNISLQLNGRFVKHRISCSTHDVGDLPYNIRCASYKSDQSCMFLIMYQIMNAIRGHYIDCQSVMGIASLGQRKRGFGVVDMCLPRKESKLLHQSPAHTCVYTYIVYIDIYIICIICMHIMYTCFLFVYISYSPT